MDTFDTLVLSLPTRNSTLRMRLWRALKETGCAVLRDGVYLLPEQQSGAVLQRIEADIRASGGFAMTLELRPRSTEQLGSLKKLFDRSAQYGALAESISAASAALARLGAR